MNHDIILNRFNRLEKIDKGILGYIIDKCNDETKSIIDKSENSKKKKGSNYIPVLDHIKKIYSNIVLKDNEYVLKSTFYQTREGGRLTAKRGLSGQMISRPIRHAIFRDKYYDIDIVNCHPVILLQYCKMNEISCEALNELVYYRDDMFQDILKRNQGLTREDVKKCILSLLNGGVQDYNLIPNKTPSIKQFASEIKSIIKSICKLNKNIYDEVKQKRMKNGIKYNHDGATMCVILQGIENKLLECMEQVFVRNHCPIDHIIPVHDGMMVPKEYISNLEQIMRDTEEYIKEKTGYEVSLIEKKMDECNIDIPSDCSSYCNLSITNDLFVKSDFKEEDDIYDFYNYLRSTTFSNYDTMYEYIIKNIDRYIKLCCVPTSILCNNGRGNIELVPVVSTFIICCYMVETEDGAVMQYEKLSNIIFTPKLLREVYMYKNITFRPHGDTFNGEFNMFKGFKSKQVQDVNMTLIYPVLKHIKECWACGDDNLYDYILSWFSKLFSNPSEKTGVVLLLYGLEGTGKGFLIDNLIVPHIYGAEHSSVVQGLTPLTQRFNSILMNKLFICANEVSSEESFHNAFDKLKAIITDNTINIEKKGIDIFKNYPNYINFIFTTNNYDSVKLGRSDRRYCCLHTSDKFKGDFEYFERLMDSCTQEVANHFYTYCINYDTGRNLRQIPMTQLKEEMMLNCKTPIEKFSDNIKEIFGNDFTDFEGIVGDERNADWDKLLIAHSHYNDSGERVINSSTLYKVFDKWCRDCNEKKKNSTLFGREMKHFFEKRKTRHSNIYVLTNEE